MPKYKFSEIAYNINQKKMPEPGDEEMYIGLEHLDNGSLKVKRWGSDVPITGEKLVMKKGDILFGRRNTYLRRAAIAPHDGIFSAHGMIFRPNTAVMDEDYFPFFISSDYFMNAAIRISVGSLSPTVNWKTLKELEFDIPDLESQRKSAELLTAANRLKEAYEILLEETDQLVKSQFIEMFGDPITNEKNWKIATLKEVCIGKLSYGSGAAAVDYDGKTRYVRITDITDTGELSDDVKSPSVIDEKYLLHEGDILFARSGATVGKTLLYREKFGRSIYAGFLIRLIPNKHIVLPDYVFGFTKSAYYEEFVKKTQRAVGQPNINAQEYGDLKICVPPLELQSSFSSFLKQSDKSKFEIKQSIKNITEVINSLLQQDFNI